MERSLNNPHPPSCSHRLQQIQPPPDLLLLTGDLSQDETPESYQRLVSLIAPLGIPAYWIPGNHDNIPVMAEILNQPPLSPEKSWMLGNWQFLLLSSVEAGCDGGGFPQKACIGSTLNCNKRRSTCYHCLAPSSAADRL